MARDFDLKTLEKELATAVQVEEKRVLVDEVKKKAVHSTGSYEEFRQRVLAADLKPVTTKEFEGAFRRYKGDKVARNRAISKIDRTGAKVPSKAMKPRKFRTDGPATKPAKNAMEFKREWRRHCTTPETRYRYLNRFSSKRVLKVLQSELDGTILGEIVGAMAKCLPHRQANSAAAAAAGEGDAKAECTTDDSSTAASAPGPDKHALWCLRVLRALSQVNRFGLALKLLSEEDVAAVKQLFEALRAWSEAGEQPPPPPFTTDELRAVQAAFLPPRSKKPSVLSPLATRSRPPSDELDELDL